jgi:mannose-6-phosphate isomerase
MQTKEQVFGKAAFMLSDLGFTVVNKDDSRPWGGFYVIDETQAAAFAQQYFPGENFDALKITNKPVQKFY